MVKAAFGASVTNSIFLAAQPDEWEDNYKGHRTFVLDYAKANLQLNCMLSGTVFTVWFSDNGTAYCPANNGVLYVYSDLTWRKEQVSNIDEEFQHAWGISGKNANSDTVFLCSKENLYIRKNYEWKVVPFPEKGVHKCHGLDSDEVYVTTPSGILLWNGENLVELEYPGEYPRGVLVLSKNELLVVGNENIHIWSDEKQWVSLPTPASSHGNSILRFRNTIFISTLEGVLKYEDGKVEWANRFICISLFDLGDGVLSTSSDASYFYNGEDWQRVLLPSFVKDENVDSNLF